MRIHKRQAEFADNSLIAIVKRGAFSAVDHRPEKIGTPQCGGVISNKTRIDASCKGKRTLHHDFIGLHRNKNEI